MDTNSKMSKDIFKRFKPDTHSIKFKLWLYFVLFAAGLMLLLWFLQIFFLNHYYSNMKETTIDNAVSSMVFEYQNAENEDQFIGSMNSIAESNGMYTYIETRRGKDAFPNHNWSSKAAASVYADEKDKARKKLIKNKDMDSSVSFKTTRPDSENEILVYAIRLKQNENSKKVLFMYCITPLYPVDGTISILKTQLIYITIIGLAVAFLIALYLATRISNPISSINASAKKLAGGKYGITFTESSYSEIDALADTLTRTSMELEKSDNMQRDMIANVSHDLRTPLTMVKSYAEMIRDLSGDNPEKRNLHLQVIIDEADRLNQLVEDMLQLSRMQGGAIVLDRTIFNLKETVKTLMQPYEILEKQEGLHVYFVCQESYLFVDGDEERIKQVISNLINNAVKFAGTDNTVIVNLKRHGDKALCEVIDHGVGIPQAELSHIWEKYYKNSQNAGRPVQGTGLGLSICKEILTLHHVRFGVNSELGRGTTFWFEMNTRRSKETRERLALERKKAREQQGLTPVRPKRPRIDRETKEILARERAAREKARREKAKKNKK